LVFLLLFGLELGRINLPTTNERQKMALTYLAIERQLSDNSLVYDIEIPHDDLVIKFEDEHKMEQRAKVFDARGYKRIDIYKTKYQF
jgi:hypothetical protein